MVLLVACGTFPLHWVVSLILVSCWILLVHSFPPSYKYVLAGVVTHCITFAVYQDWCLMGPIKVVYFHVAAKVGNIPESISNDMPSGFAKGSQLITRSFSQQVWRWTGYSLHLLPPSSMHMAIDLKKSCWQLSCFSSGMTLHDPLNSNVCNCTSIKGSHLDCTAASLACGSSHI